MGIFVYICLMGNYIYDMINHGLTPDEFNKFLNQKMDEDQIEIFYRANAINPLKVELFRDFTISLLDTIHDTYPGDDVYSDNYYSNHCTYCFNRVINNFTKENLYFDGVRKEIYEYFYLTLEEAYYKDSEKNKTIIALKNVYDKIFDMESMNKTQSDMEIFLDIYKSFLKLFINKEYEIITNFN